MYDLVHSPFVFLVTSATKVGKIVNPAVIVQPNKFTASKVSLQCQVRSTLRIIERVFGLLSDFACLSLNYSQQTYIV